MKDKLVMVPVVAVIAALVRGRAIIVIAKMIAPNSHVRAKYHPPNTNHKMFPINLISTSFNF